MIEIRLVTMGCSVLRSAIWTNRWERECKFTIAILKTDFLQKIFFILKDLKFIFALRTSCHIILVTYIFHHVSEYISIPYLCNFVYTSNIITLSLFAIFLLL